MNDSTLWAIALSVGVLGLLLVVVAGIAGISANSRARRSRDRAGPGEPHRPEADVGEERVEAGGWLWLKAGVFAFIHAGAVSFVLGGLTFFEDIARANEEIRTTGTVTFPKRLLPKTLVGPDSSLSLARAREDMLANGRRAPHEAHDPPSRERAESATADPSDWEVVDVVPEETV